MHLGFSSYHLKLRGVYLFSRGGGEDLKELQQILQLDVLINHGEGHRSFEAIRFIINGYS